MAQLLSEHCVTRSVRDSFSWLQMTERNSWQMKLPTQDAVKKTRHRLRIGFHTTSSSGLSPEQDAKDAVLTAVRACEALGHSVVEVTPPGVDMDAAAKAFFALGGASVSNALDYFRSIFGDAFADDKLERYTKALASHGRGWMYPRWMPRLRRCGALRTISTRRSLAMMFFCAPLSRFRLLNWANSLATRTSRRSTPLSQAWPNTHSLLLSRVGPPCRFRYSGMTTAYRWGAILLRATVKTTFFSRLPSNWKRHFPGSRV